jgi:hypothetical protein
VLLERVDIEWLLIWPCYYQKTGVLAFQFLERQIGFGSMMGFEYGVGDNSYTMAGKLSGITKLVDDFYHNMNFFQNFEKNCPVFYLFIYLVCLAGLNCMLSIMGVSIFP